jgi:hypothetical protein
MMRRKLPLSTELAGTGLPTWNTRLFSTLSTRTQLAIRALPTPASVTHNGTLPVSGRFSLVREWPVPASGCCPGLTPRGRIWISLALRVVCWSCNLPGTCLGKLCLVGFPPTVVFGPSTLAPRWGLFYFGRLLAASASRQGLFVPIPYLLWSTKYLSDC